MAKQPARLPQELLERLEQQFGAGAVKQMLVAFGVQRLTTCRTNTLLATDEQVMDFFRDAQIQFERVKHIPHAFKIKNLSDAEVLELPLCVEGKFYVQGLSSMLPPILLHPEPGDKVLDLCAAPGSKTSQVAAMMNARGELFAFEENAIRVQKLEHTLRLQGILKDTSEHVFAHVRHEDASLAHKEFPEYFDKVLADVPCSAEGRICTLDARTFGFWSQKNIVAHAKLQRRLLKSAVLCLKPGGILVYSTCTLAPEENERMVDWLLTEFPDLKSEKVTVPFIAKHHSNGSATVLPTAEMEGFFVARFTRRIR